MKKMPRYANRESGNRGSQRGQLCVCQARSEILQIYSWAWMLMAATEDMVGWKQKRHTELRETLAVAGATIVGCE